MTLSGKSIRQRGDYTSTTFVYQSGKARTTSIHELISTIEGAIRVKQVALVIFLDIHRGFDNTTYMAIEGALKDKMIQDLNINWIINMLNFRRVILGIVVTCWIIWVNRGCPQWAVRSPLVWTVVRNELLLKVNNMGFKTLDYANNCIASWYEQIIAEHALT